MKPKGDAKSSQARSSNGGVDVREQTRELLSMGCGRPIGRYTLLRRIAAGGMAEVYVARQKGISGIEKKVAIKKILPQHSHNERFIDMLVDEAKITVALTHPNIAQVYELGLDGEDYFIVMEFINGRPLNRLMQRVDERGLNTVPVEYATHIIAEVAKGLEHAHRQKDDQGRNRGIVHRDVSPQNVLVSYQGDVKLIDFGIARAEGRLNRTSHGVIKGKLRYLAPEIAAGEEPDHRADIFCCGIVLFETLTGEAMFAPKSDMEAIEMATEARVKSPRSRNPKVPQDLDDIVMKALARDREKRYQTGKELYSDLRLFLNQYFPSFLSSDLGDFMGDMFEREIVLDRKLDETADRIAKGNASIDEEEDPTIANTGGMPLGVFPAQMDRKGYKQIVTRLAIGEGTDSGALNAPSPNSEERLVWGADGGRAMEVVPASRPLIRNTSALAQASTLPPGVEGTLPPKNGQFVDDALAAVEPTVKADNPFTGMQSVLPTVTGPPPEDQVLQRRLPTVAGGDGFGPPSGTHEDSSPSITHSLESSPLSVWEENESKVILAERTQLGEGSKSIMIRSGPPRWVYIPALVAVLLAGLLAVWMMRPKTPKEQPTSIAANNETVIPPVSIAPPSAKTGDLTLKVSPEVPVTIAVGGKILFPGETPPVQLPNLPSNQAHRITVSADGYVPQEVSIFVAPGEKKTLSFELQAALGTITVKASRYASVRSSHGRVRGKRITSIPLDTVVKVTVSRPGSRSFSKSVHVTSTEPIELEVPALKRLPKGTLILNARPRSTVYIDGRRRGKTPLKVRLKPGRHRITYKGPSGGKRTIFRTVRPASVVRHTHRWSQR